jgi:hypothetical protein
MLAHNFKLSEPIRIQSFQCRGAVASFFSVSLPLDKPAIDLRFLGWEVIYAGNDVEFLQRRRAAADSSIEGDCDLSTDAPTTI